MRQPPAGDPIDELSAGTPCHAKRVLAQPVSNGTLISGSDRAGVSKDNMLSYRASKHDCERCSLKPHCEHAAYDAG